MSKFCGNCGAQSDDNAVVCGSCGTPLNQDNPSSATGSIPGVEYVDPVKAAKNSNFIKIGVGAAALVIVAIIVISIIASATGYKGAV